MGTSTIAGIEKVQNQRRLLLREIVAMKVSMRTFLCALVMMMAVAVPNRCWATWKTSGDWQVLAEDALAVRNSDKALAWKSTSRPGQTWSVSAEIKFGKARAAIPSALLVFGDSLHKPILRVNIRRYPGDLSQVEVEIYRTDWQPILSSGWISGGDAAYVLRLARQGGCLSIVLQGDRNVSYRERTPEIPRAVLDPLAAFGVGADGADVEFSGLKFDSPAEQPGHYAIQAEAAVADLLKNFWSGGFDHGCIVPTSHGFPAPVLPDPRGGLWERGMMLFAMDTLHRATGDVTIARRLKSEWNRIKRLYTAEELEAAGGPLHPACDDTGWDAMLYLVLYRHSRDLYVLDRAKGLINNGFRRWHDGELGGGIWYNNKRQEKSLYQVALVLDAFAVWEATGDVTFKQRALACYEWMESHLLRPDGIYWCDVDRLGPRGQGPNIIHEAGSCTFLAGNMAMAVLHARLYRLTGEKRYLDRALRTADSVARTLTCRGVYLDDRDAWANGTFAADWVQDVLTLPGIDGRHKDLLFRTADSIYRNARTSDGFYGGAWGGPADGPGSPWSTIGSRPQQIMTSGSSVNMIAAAALAEKLLDPAGPAGAKQGAASKLLDQGSKSSRGTKER